jgi:HemK-like putative methylase
MGDLGQEFGAFSTLLRERYTDPVSELAADAACCCDSLRDSLADMAADTKAFSEIKDANTLTQIMDSSQEEEFPEMVEAVSQLNNQTTSAHVLLRISIEELENQWVQRVKERRPFQYIVGCAHWRDLVLSVQEGVLIPRPETEQMIDLAEAAIMGNPSLAVGLWADLGTGSGAIAIALARLLRSPGSVLAVDMSETAVAVARRNVGHYALTVRLLYHPFFLSFILSKRDQC